MVFCHSLLLSARLLENMERFHETCETGSSRYNQQSSRFWGDSKNIGSSEPSLIFAGRNRAKATEYCMGDHCPGTVKFPGISQTLCHFYPVAYPHSTYITTLHRRTMYVDAAYCYRLSSIICQSVCHTVTVVNPAKWIYHQDAI